MSQIKAALIVALCISSGANAIKFTISKNQPRCFEKYLDKNEHLYGKYQVVREEKGKLELTPPGYGIHVKVSLKKSSEIIMSRSYGNMGTFSFTAPEDSHGEPFLICIDESEGVSDKLPQDKLQVSVTFHREVHHPNSFEQIGKEIAYGIETKLNDSYVDLLAEAKKLRAQNPPREKLTLMEHRVNELIELTDRVLDEIKSWSEVEKEFRGKSTRINRDVFIWAALQITLLIMIGCYQSHHMVSFFQAKKLV